MTLWIIGPVLLLFSSLARLQELPHPPDCCLQKYLPGSGHYTYLGVSPDLQERYGCLDDCTYVKDGTDEKYCFATGPYEVICQEYPCGPPECNKYCKAGEECVEDLDIDCVQAPCCARWSCNPGLISTSYITINESGTVFNQTVENTPEYFKIMIPARNNRMDAVVFWDSKTGYRVSCSQGMDTAAPSVLDINPNEAMKTIIANAGMVTYKATEDKIYFVEEVSNVTIPNDERPVDIAPDRPIYRSTLREVTQKEYDAMQARAAKALAKATCFTHPSFGHVLTVRVGVWWNVWEDHHGGPRVEAGHSEEGS